MPAKRETSLASRAESGAAHCTMQFGAEKRGTTLQKIADYVRAGPRRPQMKKYTRQHPRVNLSLPIQVIRPNGVVIHSTIFSLSRDGIQLSCDHQTARLIIPKLQQKLAVEPVQIQVRFRLPLSNRPPVEIDVQCLAKYVRRTSQDNYYIGLNYIDLNDDYIDDVERYIEERMVAAERSSATGSRLNGNH